MEEIWCTITGFSRYHVSNQGRIASIKKNGNIKILLYKPRESGYIKVDLIDDTNKRNSLRAHRLVAAAFIPNPDNKPYVDHINGIRSDNRAKNLRWVTTAENNQNRTTAKRFKVRAVVQFNLDRTLVKVWESIVSIKRELSIAHHKIKQSSDQGIPINGFYWRFQDSIPIEDEEWKQVAVNNHSIDVSSVGRVKTLNNWITYGHEVNTGYLATHVEDITTVVHRLICFAFKPIDNPEDFEVNHIDGNRKNNRIENLEWVTPSENIQHMFKSKQCKNQRPVAQLTTDGILLAFYLTLKDAAKDMGIHPSGIINACSGKYQTCKRFKWTYIGNYDD